MDTILYFAYGSNMNYLQMRSRCPAARFFSRGRLHGWEFVINTRGVASLATVHKAVTQGVVYAVTPLCVSSLDVFEGVASGHYGRFLLPVVMEGGYVRKALVYIDPNSNPGYPRVGYLEKVIAGARERRLSRLYIRELNKWRII